MLSFITFQNAVKREILNDSIIQVYYVDMQELILRCSLTIQCYVSYLYSCRGRHQLLFPQIKQNSLDELETFNAV